MNLTRKQIEDSPAIESHKPLSRQYEEEYYRYYGWPFYWQGDALWGMSRFPILDWPSKPLRSEPTVASSRNHGRADAHLWSVAAVNGYQLQGSDGTIGHVCDFMMDDQNWAIGHLLIKTGHRFSGQEVLMPSSKVDRISYQESSMFVSLTRETVEHSPADPLAPVGATD